MIFIGEKLNSSIPSARRMMESGDLAGLRDVIQAQSRSGADFLDINTALCEDEAGMMRTVCGLCLQNSNCGIVIDSPKPEVCAEAAACVRQKSDRPCIINSVTLDERHGCIDAALKYGTGLVVLLTDGHGIPAAAGERRANAERAVKMLTQRGLRESDIYVDVIVESAAANADAAKTALETVRLVRGDFPDVHILCGLSNISFGLPERKVVNRAFLTLAVYLGADSAICDVTCADLRQAALAAEVLNGTDDFCMNYLDAFRRGTD